MCCYVLEPNMCVVSRPQCSGDELRKNLADWLTMPQVHFYIRPLLGNLVIIDVDDYGGHEDLLVKLQPRALVQTSPGNYKM